MNETYLLLDEKGVLIVTFVANKKICIGEMVNCANLGVHEVTHICNLLSETENGIVSNSTALYSKEVKGGK